MRQARLVPVRLGKASRGTLWLGRYGKVRFGKAWSDRVGQAWSGLASSGEFGRGAAVEVWCGMVRLGLARQARRGMKLKNGQNHPVTFMIIPHLSCKCKRISDRFLTVFSEFFVLLMQL